MTSVNRVKKGSKLRLRRGRNISQHHKIAWARSDLKDHLVPDPQSWAGTPPTIPGGSEPHPTQP